MEDFAFTRARIAADRRARLIKVAKCAAVTLAAGALGWALTDEASAVLLAGVALVASTVLF